MSLYWPQNPADVDLTRPGLHALVIGVGDYPHLMSGTGLPAVASFGLQQLTTTIFTAIRIAEWLAGAYTNTACPLGSIELLLSPGQTLARPDGSLVPIESAIMENVRNAFGRWYTRCNMNAGNIAFFYFAGHGLSTASQFLLPADFGAPNIPPNLWENCIDFDGLRTGMRMNTADTQLFFVDACREAPIDALLQLNPRGDPLVNGATIFDQVAATGTYFAAAAGRKAYGPADSITFFATAMLDALEGAGALNRGGKYVVDIYSLGHALAQITANLALVHNQPLTCNIDPEGKAAAIHLPPSAIVRASIGCHSDAANQEVQIILKRGSQCFLSQQGEPRPWTGRLHPGDWEIQMSFQSFPAVVQMQTLMSPVFDWEEPI